MGCVSSEEIMAHSRSLRDIPLTNFHNCKKNISQLEKGGILIKTCIGNVQFGIPPETVKDSMSMGTAVPEYFIVPTDKFDWNDGMNLMEFEFPVYYNFFLRKQNKTKLICDRETMNQIRIIFQETLLGPKEFPDFKKDFADGYNAIPDIEKELAHFANNPFNPKEKLSIELFIEFIIFDSKGEVTINKEVEDENQKKVKQELKIIRKCDKFQLFENGKFYTEFDDSLQVDHSNYYVYRTLEQEVDRDFVPPVFGFTMLGNSHGFDTCGSTSGFIIWINRKGIMVDPPPFTSKSLRYNNIPPSMIEKIIISHCHADHDAGAFHKIIEASPVEFISTPTIMNSFVRKYAAISGISQEEIKSLFQYRHIAIGHPTYICGARFVFEYSFHSIPTICFSIEFQNKKFFFSGDTFYNPVKLEEMYNQGLFSHERFVSLGKRDFSQFDLIFHEAGIPPIHTPASIFIEWPEEMQKKLYLYHIAAKDVANFPTLKTMKNGLTGTVVLLDNDHRRDNKISNLELLCSMEIIRWAPFNRITEIIKCFVEKKYSQGERIVESKTFGNTFYIIKSGTCKVYSDEPKGENNFSKLYFPGDYFGEAAIIGNGFRLANVEAMTEVVLLEINKYDFKWIFEHQADRTLDRLSPMEMIKNLAKMRKAQLAEFVNSNETISRMTENQKSFLNMYIKEQTVFKGEQLWRIGEQTDYCFMIKTGKYQMRAPFNRVPKKFTLSPGTLVGDFPNLHSPEVLASSEVTCVRDGIILTISRENFSFFLRQYPGFFILCKNKFVIY